MFISNYTGRDIDTAVGKVLDGKVGGMTPITYTELKQLRDNSQLIPGMQYRITDYETFVASREKPMDTISAGHQFDIIVTADSESVLNEKARAIQHEGDTYFANSNLAAWEIWYCLDNDTDRFAWAKKPLYYDGDRDMINVLITPSNDYFIYIRYPEKNKDGKYAWTTDVQLLQDETFKNVVDNVSVNLSEINIISTDEEKPGVGTAVIAFGNSDCKIVDVSWTEGKGVIYRMIDEFGNDCPYDFKNIQFARWELSNPSGRKAIYKNDKWDYIPYDKYNSLKVGFYGLSSNKLNSSFEFGIGCSVSYTISAKPTYCYTFGKDSDYSLNGNSNNNVIKEYHDNKDYEKMYLNNIVFLDGNCSYNTFNGDCCDITLGDNCNDNTFGKTCSDITFGKGCHRNTFGNSCCYIIFGNTCNSNTFGNESGEANASVTIFHNYCSYNTLGNNCNYITLGENCVYNTFMLGAYSITMGDRCYYNYFGGDCRSITFGNGSEIKGNYSNIVFENHNVNICLDCTASRGDYDEFSNVRIASGYNYNTMSSPDTYTIESSEKNQTYSTVYGRNKSGRTITYGI